MLADRLAAPAGGQRRSSNTPRATTDVALYAELPLDARAGVEAALMWRGFDFPAMAAELQHFGVFRSKHRAQRVFLDIFDATGPLGEAILDRRKQLTTEHHASGFGRAK